MNFQRKMLFLLPFSTLIISSLCFFIQSDENWLKKKLNNLQEATKKRIVNATLKDNIKDTSACVAVSLIACSGYKIYYNYLFICDHPSSFYTSPLSQLLNNPKMIVLATLSGVPLAVYMSTALFGLIIFPQMVYKLYTIEKRNEASPVKKLKQEPLQELSLF